MADSSKAKVVKTRTPAGSKNVSSLPNLLGDGFHGARTQGKFLRVRDLLQKSK